MAKILLRSAVVAGLLAIALCSLAAAEDVWYPWWDRAPDVTYLWDDWSNMTGNNPYTIAPDSVTGPGGAALATLTVGNPGAGLIAGPADGFGSATNFWDLGPGSPASGAGGSIHLDMDLGTQGTDFLLSVKYHDGMAVAPSISILGAQQLWLTPTDLDAWIPGESTGDVGPGQPTGWVTYVSLWRLDPGTTFTGIDITADPGMGSIIDKVEVDTHILPEPGAVVLGLLGCSTLFTLRRYRRK